jgi:hypothetical protein
VAAEKPVERKGHVVGRALGAELEPHRVPAPQLADQPSLAHDPRDLQVDRRLALVRAGVELDHADRPLVDAHVADVVHDHHGFPRRSREADVHRCVQRFARAGEAIERQNHPDPVERGKRGSPEPVLVRIVRDARAPISMLLRQPRSLHLGQRRCASEPHRYRNDARTPRNCHASLPVR